MYSAYKSNKQDDNLQSWRTPFPIWNQSVIPCPVVTVASWPAYMVSQEAGKVVWYFLLFKSFPQFVVIRTVKGFIVVNEAKVDVFLEFPCFFCDPINVGNLVSGSSAFSKSNLNIWKFLVHILLKSSLKDFEHYLASMWNEYSCVVVWTFFGTPLLWDWNENWPFPVLWPLLGFPYLLHVACSILTASSFRIWNSSPGIPSPPPALFVVRRGEARLVLFPLCLDSIPGDCYVCLPCGSRCQLTLLP